MPLKSEKEIAELEEAYESVVHQIPEDLEGDSDLISNTGPEAAEGFESSVPEYEKKMKILKKIKKNQRSWSRIA